MEQMFLEGCPQICICFQSRAFIGSSIDAEREGLARNLVPPHPKGLCVGLSSSSTKLIKPCRPSSVHQGTVMLEQKTTFTETKTKQSWKQCISKAAVLNLLMRHRLV